jgi:RNA polymerase sigma-70 factor (ECF subfamily)
MAVPAASHLLANHPQEQRQMARPINRRDVDRLVVEHLPAALRLAVRLSGDADAAEEIVQEALCRVLRGWRTFRGESSFKTWMLQIVVNAERDRRRRPKVFTPEQDDVLEPISNTPPPPDAVATRELHAELRAAVGRLPQRQREVALLTWGEGLAASDVAQVLGTSEANVYTNLHLARKQVAQAIGYDLARPQSK